MQRSIGVDGALVIIGSYVGRYSADGLLFGLFLDDGATERGFFGLNFLRLNGLCRGERKRDQFAVHNGIDLLGHLRFHDLWWDDFRGLNDRLEADRHDIAP